jgi:cell shape-determining protein MreC
MRPFYFDAAILARQTPTLSMSVFYFLFIGFFAASEENNPMRRKNPPSIPHSDLATKNDVRGIVTEIIDNFAVMVKHGFDDIHERMVTKEEFNELRAEMYEFKTNMLEFKNGTEPALYSLQTDMLDVKSRLTKVETRLTGVEDGLISLTAAAHRNWQDHEQRITTLEERVT